MQSQLHKLLNDFCVLLNSESTCLVAQLVDAMSTRFPDYRAKEAAFTSCCYAITFYDRQEKFLGEINIIDCSYEQLAHLPSLYVCGDKISVGTYQDILQNDVVIVGYTHSCTDNLAHIVRVSRWFEHLYRKLIAVGRTVLIEVSGILEVRSSADISLIRCSALGKVKKESKAVSSFVTKLGMRKVPQVFEFHTGGCLYIGNS